MPHLCRDTNKRPSQMRLESNPALSALFLFIKSFIFHHIYLVLQHVTLPPVAFSQHRRPSLRFTYPFAASSSSVDLSFKLSALQRAEQRNHKKVASKEPHASSGVDYVKKWGQTHSTARLYMDCKIKVSLNIQHAVQ